MIFTPSIEKRFVQILKRSQNVPVAFYHETFRKKKVRIKHSKQHSALSSSVVCLQTESETFRPAGGVRELVGGGGEWASQTLSRANLHTWLGVWLKEGEVRDRLLS